MLVYKDFYKKKGINFIRDMLTPLVWDTETITYPKQTMLLWPNGTSVVRNPTREYGYFSMVNKPYVYTITKYVNSDLEHLPKLRAVNENKIIKTAKLAEPSFKYIKGAKQVTIPVVSPVIINLGAVHTGYRYTSHPLNSYYVWYNSLDTVATMATNNITGNSRHKYIIMELPYDVPPRELVRKHLGVVTRESLKVFSGSSYLNLLELFRFLDINNKDRSVLATRIPEDEFKNIDLLLTINNKVTVMNLEILASISDAYNIETLVKKYPSGTALKLLYIMLNKIIESSAMSDTLGADTMEDIASITDTTPVQEEVVLDDIIDNELDTQPTLLDKDEELLETELAKDTVDDTVDDMQQVDLSTITTATELTDHSDTIAAIKALKENKLITKNSQDDLIDILTNQHTIKSPYNDGTTLGDMLDLTTEEVLVSKEDSVITDSPSVLDKTMNSDPISAINKRYIDTTMRKDILSTIYSIQRTGVVIKNHEIVTTKSILGEIDEHVLTLQTVEGVRSTIRIKLPVISSDNTMTLSGNKFVMRRQRADY